MIRDRLERIRERAYQLWEKAGGGHGRHEEHWIVASSEIDAEDGKPAAKARKTRAKVAPPRRSVAKGASETAPPVSAPAARARGAAKAKPVSAKPASTHKSSAKK